jgi:transposase
MPNRRFYPLPLFLPPYSPELNPIELAFSKIKQQLKFKKPRTFDELLSAIKVAFDSISSHDAIGFFNHVFQY